MTYPLSLHLSNALPDKQDPLLNLWILVWEAHQVVRAPLRLFDANIFYPFQHTLAYSETLLSTSGLVFPFALSPATRIVGYNVAFLGTFFLAALGTYLLVFSLTGSRPAGIVAGLIFAFAPFRFGHLSQIQLLSSQWFPFVILALDRLLRRASHSAYGKIQYKSILLFVLFFSLQCLASFYYAFQAALVVVLYTLAFFIVHRRHVHRAVILHLSLAAILSALVVLLPSVPYLQVQRELNAGWSLASNETFSASLQAYLYTAPNNALYGSLTSSLAYVYGPCCPPDTLFPGLLPLLLAMLGLASWRRQRPGGTLRLRQGFYSLLLIAAFILSLGPSLHIRAGELVRLPFSLPYAWLYHTLPIFRAMRAPVRFANLVMLALAILAGWGTASLLRRFRSRRQLVVAIALGTVVLLEYATVPMKLVQIPQPSQVPAVYRWLAGKPPAVILELPMANKLPTPTPQNPSDPRQAWETSRLLEHQYFSTFHWHTTPDGYSGFIPPRHGEVVYEMERFPSARAVALLQALDVRWVVLHHDDFAPKRWAKIMAALPKFPQLQQVQTFGDDYVFRVAPAETSLGHEDVGGYLPQAAQAGSRYVAYAILRLRGTTPVAAKPTDRVPVRATWTDEFGHEKTEQTFFTRPLVNSGAEVREILLTAPALAGSYTLSLAAEEAGGLHFHVEGSVTVGDHPGQGERPVPVRLTPPTDLPHHIAPGDTLHVVLRWEALGKIDEYDSAFVRLVDGAGRALAQIDHGAGGTQHPTLLWNPGETITDTYTLAIPNTAAPGNYRLEAGLYRPEGIEPRLLLDGDGHLVRVVPLASMAITR
ncbi:MAG: YfhO family protein [Chloroflexi bacterium]|nr:YfhO family protein [Chloroflexota bacterium]